MRMNESLLQKLLSDMKSSSCNRGQQVKFVIGITRDLGGQLQPHLALTLSQLDATFVTC